MRSVNNKTHELLMNTHSIDYDILVFSETWLNPDQCDREFLDKKYKSFRKDRSDSDIEADRGGGVLIAMKKELDCEEYRIAEMTDLESVCVKINLGKSVLIVYALYIQPSASIETYKKHLVAVNQIQRSASDIIVIAGDWNMPDISWKLNDSGFDFVPLIGESQSEKALIAKHVTEFMMENEFFQICNLSNKKNNTLDLIYVNMPELCFVEKADLLLISKESQDNSHVQMVCTIECEPQTFNQCVDGSPIYCFKKSNFDAINECLSEIDFKELLSSEDVNIMVESLYNKLYSIFDEHVPKATRRIDNKPIWYDKKLNNLKNIRNKEYKKLCQRRASDPSADEAKFVRSRDEFDDYQQQLYEQYIKDLVANSKSNPKMFWKHVNGKRISNELPNKIELEGVQAIDDKGKCQLFAKYFSSVYVDYGSSNDISEMIASRNDNGMCKIINSREAVPTALISMDTNKGMGPDFISPLILKKCAEHSSEPLSIIYEKSMNDCVYPERFKVGHITPIFKSGNKSKIVNYRGVNVMPNLAKVFERVVYNQLKLIIMPKLSKSQHGFLMNRNIETNLLEFTMQVNNSFEHHSQTDSFCADISKAFDTVKQSLLISKLAKFPVNNSVLSWFTSYFKDCNQCVKVGSSLSDSFNVPSSLGQGTILGPLLFLVFFNDSDDNANGSAVYNFADDKRIAREFNNLTDAENLQISIDNFIKWCDMNSLQINPSKCKVITFSHKKQPIAFDYMINGEKIDRVDHIRDLGVILDSKLSMVHHLEMIKKKSLSNR